MKGNIEEIVAKLKPETTIEELISYCYTTDDFNMIFEEYCKCTIDNNGQNSDEKYLN